MKRRKSKTIEECFLFKDKPTVTWINIDGLHQVEILEKLGECYGLHPLVLEDILNTDQRPKMEDYGEYLYIVLRMLNYNDKSSEIEAEQISLILGPNFVFLFRKGKEIPLTPIRERIRNSKGRIRKMGADYLTYTLLDSIVDNYFIILEKLGEKIEFLEEELVTRPTPETLQIIHHLKREMIFLRKAVWPLREVIGGLERGESSLIKETTRVYLRDVYDHTIQVIDTDRNIQGHGFRNARHLSFKRQQPVECGDEGIDHHRYHLYAPHLSCRDLWDEFQIYAGTGVAMGLSSYLGDHGWNWSFHVTLFQKKEVVMKL